MSATVRIPAAWELSDTLTATADPALVDLFFRVHQPHYTKEGERHVLTIPPKSPGEYPESYISEPGRSLDAFCADITHARVRERVTSRMQESA